MNVKKFQLHWLWAVVSLAFLMSVSSAQAAITKLQPSKNQEIVFFVESDDLAGLKQAFVDVNLHLRKEGRSTNQPIKLIIHGSGVKFLKKVGIDPELEYMLRWFQDESIHVGVCGGCLIEHGVEKDSLFTGLQIWKNKIPKASFLLG